MVGYKSNGKTNQKNNANPALHRHRRCSRVRLADDTRILNLIVSQKVLDIPKGKI